MPRREWLESIEPQLQQLFERIIGSGKIKMATRARIAMFLDDKLHGKANETIDLKGGPITIQVTDAMGKRFEEADRHDG